MIPARVKLTGILVSGHAVLVDATRRALCAEAAEMLCTIQMQLNLCCGPHLISVMYSGKDKSGNKQKGTEKARGLSHTYRKWA